MAPQNHGSRIGKRRKPHSHAQQKPAFHASRLISGNSEEADGYGQEISAPEETSEILESTEDEAEPKPRPYHVLLGKLTAQKAPAHRLSRKRTFEEFQNIQDQDVTNDPTTEISHEADDIVSDSSSSNEVDEESDAATSDVSEARNGLNDGLNYYDSFAAHFSIHDNDGLLTRLKDAEDAVWSEMPNRNIGSLSKKSGKLTKIYTPGPVKDDDLQKAVSAESVSNILSSLKLKRKLSMQFQKRKISEKNVETIILSSLFRYRDVFFPARTLKNAPSNELLICTHILNHVLTNRDRVLKNNSRLSSNDNEELDLRDQGFTRPKILFILPTRQSCARIVEMLAFLYGAEQEENKKRFQDEYISKDHEFSQEKPADFRDLFAGNDDDMFRIGLKLTRKTLKYFSQFYTSDIILASPLGLKLALGGEDKILDDDFLSSIEIVVVNQADALLMQNWEHLDFIFEHLNNYPKDLRKCDISRVNYWYLEGKARYMRQTIVLSAYSTPELRRFANTQMKNIDGRIELYPTFKGEIQDFHIRIKQSFFRFDATSPMDDSKARFNVFTTAIIPSIIRHVTSSGSSGSGILVFIPSYLDFVRLRNFLATSTEAQNISFGSVSEYSDVREMTRTRSNFFAGRYSVLLYTERAHHFRRFQIRGVKQVYMYGLPDNPTFYKEVVGGFLTKSVAEGTVSEDEVSCKTIFSKYDRLKLERIVGSDRYLNMLCNRDGDTFDFV